ncbi:hypothetical protein J45TS6_39140 [Paenibacillus sp. J45TS6]|uniref:hypothetical protein n=1 Tax=Paenibacillus sp. J45TS6 TaxID=2807196 RepID=UPI001AFD76F3|nr:hypothetical protein [Paenibacillus sp. J45TS6]GIP45455.1 hypothetical protein J45TS6_39140 [Paenibacillus sp. J45TS6]
MKQIRLILLILLMMSLLSACWKSDNSEKPIETSLENQTKGQTEVSSTMTNITDYQNSNERFSYLKQLSLEKQEAFNRFTIERDLQELNKFTPEDMVLVYLYCISIGDPDLIYEITYDGGYLPNKDVFREDYFDYVMIHDLERAIQYRYFDSIKVEESTAEENQVTVLITVVLESSTYSLALGLKKEDQIWKLDIYHSIKEYKNKALKNKDVID